MGRAIVAVEEAEKHRMEMVGRQDSRDQERISLKRNRIAREEKSLALEELRLETEAIVAEDRNNIEIRRVDLEE